MVNTLEEKPQWLRRCWRAFGICLLLITPIFFWLLYVGTAQFYRFKPLYFFVLPVTLLLNSIFLIRANRHAAVLLLANAAILITWAGQRMITVIWLAFFEGVVKNRPTSSAVTQLTHDLWRDLVVFQWVGWLILLLMGCYFVSRNSGSKKT